MKDNFGPLQFFAILAVGLALVLLLRFAIVSGFFDTPCDADPGSAACAQYRDVDPRTAGGL